MPAQTDAVDCIACGKALENGTDDGNQPVDAIAFTSHGHWPSRIFDSMNETFLEINVCNDCLQKAADKKRILLGDTVKLTTRHKVRYRDWKFPEEPKPAAAAPARKESSRTAGRKASAR